MKTQIGKKNICGFLLIDSDNHFTKKTNLTQDTAKYSEAYS